MSECGKDTCRTTWLWSRNNAYYVTCQNVGKMHVGQPGRGPGIMHSTSHVGKGTCRATWLWSRNNAYYITCQNVGKMHVGQPDRGPGIMHSMSHVSMWERCISGDLAVVQE